MAVFHGASMAEGIAAVFCLAILTDQTILDVLHFALYCAMFVFWDNVLMVNFLYNLPLIFSSHPSIALSDKKGTVIVRVAPD
jgi:hypothetical protein